MRRLRSAIGRLALLSAAACGIDVVGIESDQPLAADAGGPNGSPSSDASPGSVDEASTSDGSAVGARDARADPADAREEVVTPLACTEQGASIFEGHCYFTLTARTQTQAKTDCASAGAHLVSVNSLAEHQHLGTVGTGDRWIGLQASSPTNDRAQYNWVTGEPRTVTYWYPNDPDNMGPCVAFRSALQQPESWVDRGCTEANVAICERE